jgi:hypothetical protein
LCGTLGTNRYWGTVHVVSEVQSQFPFGVRSLLLFYIVCIIAFYYFFAIAIAGFMHSISICHWMFPQDVIQLQVVDSFRTGGQVSSVGVVAVMIDTHGMFQINVFFGNSRLTGNEPLRKWQLQHLGVYFNHCPLFQKKQQLMSKDQPNQLAVVIHFCVPDDWKAVVLSVLQYLHHIGN